MGQPKKLYSRGYLSLLVTQFFGAANDNILKQCLTFMIATGIWSGAVGEGGLGEGGQVVPGFCLTVPFILLSGYAGQISDKFSKQTVMFWVKVAEVPIAILAAWGFYTGNLWLTLAALLLLSIQSSFFGPAKYGVLPEVVGDEKLSMANGVINMLTNLAVIAGSLVAGPLSDLFHPELVDGALIREPLRWAPGVTFVVVAIAGLVSVMFFPRLQPANPDLKYDLNPFGTYFRSVRHMAKGPLLSVVLAWAGFYMVGLIALSIIPEYEAILDISYTKTSYLLGFMGFAIAIGSVVTGYLSGNTIKPWLIPFGAVGMSISFLLLGLLTPTYPIVATLIFAAGFFAGFYIVPLQALIQALAPDDERGQIIGTSGAISFCFSTLGLAIFWIATNPLGVPANRVHLVSAVLAIIGTIIGTLHLKRLTDADAMVGDASAN